MGLVQASVILISLLHPRSGLGQETPWLSSLWGLSKAASEVCTHHE